MGKPHAPHVVQDVRNEKDGYLKYKKVFYVFCAFYRFPFPLPLDLPLVVCYGFCAFSALCVLPLVLPLGLPPCVLHVLHVLQIPRDRLWTWIQHERTTESSDEDESEEESEEEQEEAEEAEEEEDEEGSDAASVKDEDELSLAQRAPRSTHLEVVARATRGEKYQAGAAYDNDVQVMQRTLESEYEVSLGRVCQHYKVCLAEEKQARRELGLALLLVTDVRAYRVQMVLRCGTKNAQSTAAARELFEERYPSSSPRQVATMAYTLTEDRGVDLPDTGAWTLVRTKDAKRQRVCIPVLGVVARSFHLPLELPPVCFGRLTRSTRSARSIL